MSKLDDLIREYCPDGVEYKKLEEICEINRGTRVIKKNLLESGTYPVYQNSLTPLGYFEKYNCEAETAYIIAAGAAGEIGYSYERFWAADDCYYFTSELIDSRYLSHELLNQQIIIKSKVRKASVPRLSRIAIQKLIVPVPPLPVQREIVRILDNFTELTAREKQYKYYRDRLLTFDENNPIGYVKIENKQIKDICEISRGKVISKKYIRDYEGNYPVYSSQTENNGVLGKIDTYDYDGDYLTWTTDGANAGTVFFRQGKFTITNVCGLLSVIAENVNIKYLFYILRRVAPQHVNKGMGNPKLMSNVMGNIRVPIPSLSIQDKIVSILDRFDKLCHDMTTGLPAEIEARQKQYAYYRDKLLDFKPLES